MMVWAVWSTTGLEMVGAGVAVVAAFGAGVGFAAKVSEAARRRIGRQMNRVRIIKVNAFKSGRTKNKRFLFISRETFGETTGSNVRTLPTMRLTSRLFVMIFWSLLAYCATGPRPSESVTEDTSRSVSTRVGYRGEGRNHNGCQ